MVICLEQGRLAYGPADVIATDWFYVSGTGSPGYSRTKGL